MKLDQGTYDLEAELRTMLQRQADDVQADQPEWEELIQRAQAVVVSLHTGRPLDPGEYHPRHYEPAALARRSWWRQPSFAAAVAAVVTFGCVWAFSRATSEPGEMAAEPVTKVAPVPAPGDPEFDPMTAPVIWPSDLDDPVEATRQYLAAVGIRTGGTGTVAVIESNNDGSVARVDWSATSEGGTGPSTGTVYLRNLRAGAPSSHWVVVGASTHGIRLDDVRYDGAGLAFTVVNTVGAEGGDPGDYAVTILADDRPVPFGGELLPRAGVPNPELGELIDLGADLGARAPIEVSLEGRPDVVVRVRHMNGPGEPPTAVTEMALEAPAPGEPTASTTTPGGRSTVGAGGGDAPSTSDTPLGSDGVSPPAGSEPETTLPIDPTTTEVLDPTSTDTTDIPTTTEPIDPTTTLPIGIEELLASPES